MTINERRRQLRLKQEKERSNRKRIIEDKKKRKNG